MDVKDLAQNLPLPVVQVMRRAHNAKSSEQFHLNSYFLFEVILKLATAAQVGVYLREQLRSTAVDEELLNLTLPSTGHWLRILRETARFFRKQQSPALERAVSASEQLLKNRSNLPACQQWARLALDAIKTEESITGEFSLIRLFEIFVTYRNSVIGHGAARSSAYYARMATPMLEALEEVLETGSGFLFHGLTLAHTRVGADGLVWTDLSGWIPNRLGFTVSSPEMPRPGELYLVSPREVVPLHPLVVYQEDDNEREHVAFLNKVVYKDDASRDPVRRLIYLDYATGEPLEQLNAIDAVGRILTGIKRTIGAASGKAATGSSSPFLEHDVQDTDVLPEAPAGRIAEFDILGELGKGSVGVVYRARQRTTGRMVALKVLRNLGEMTLLRFEREIRVLGRVDHRNVVKVLTAGVDGKRHYMAMELVEGSDLAGAYQVLSSWGGASRDLRGGHLTAAISSRTERENTEDADLPQAAPVQATPPLIEGGDDYYVVLSNLMADVAEGLDVLHKNGVVHRDVKPGNIMVTSDAQRAVIMDLGLAAEVDAMTLAATMATSRLLGTLPYMSPEQMAGSAGVDHRADIYSLGATLYELCCFRPMYPAKNETELIQKRATEEPAPPRKVNPRLPQGLALIIEKATHRSPKDRFETAAAMAAQLRRFARGEKLAVGGLKLTSRVAGYVRRNNLKVAAGAIALVFTLVLGAFAWRMYQQSRHIDEINRKNEAMNRENEELRRRQANAVADVERLGRLSHSAERSPEARPGPGRPVAYEFDTGAFAADLLKKHTTLALWRAAERESEARYQRDFADRAIPAGKTVLTRFLHLCTYADFARKQPGPDTSLVLQLANAALGLAQDQVSDLARDGDAYALGVVGSRTFRLAGVFHDVGRRDRASAALTLAVRAGTARVASLERSVGEAKDTQERRDQEGLLATALGNLCWYYVVTGSSREAQKSCEASLLVRPSNAWVEVNLGHALLLEGRPDDAKLLYSKHVSSEGQPGGGLGGDYADFTAAILGDFEDMRRLGVFRPEFASVEKHIQARDEEVRRTAKATETAALEAIKARVGWKETTGVAREWWEKLEQQNEQNLPSIILLCQELEKRQATITEFFLAYVYSDVDSVEGNLQYLDKMRAEREKSTRTQPRP